jgi:hypothetical protein
VSGVEPQSPETREPDPGSEASDPNPVVASQSAASPPAAPTPTFPPPDGPSSGSEPSEALTASGLPNPHGLPEIAVERPEVAVGAAFAGGLVLAMILKRLGR